MIRISLRAVVTLILALCFLHLRAEDQYLLVVQKDGTETGFALSDKPVINCASGQLTIVSDSHSISIPLADVEKYSFSSEVPSGIPLLKYEDSSINVKSGYVTIDSMPSNSIVTVFGIDGKILNSYTTDPDGHLDFDLPKHREVVIIKANSTSVKIINK